MPPDGTVILPRPRGRPRIEGAETKALAAVGTLLERGQLDGVTMEQIAELAGISKLTLYRRWPSKLALFVDALLLRMTQTQPLDEESPPPAAVATHLVRMVRQFSGPTGNMVRAVMGECLSTPGMADVLRERYLGARRQTAIRIIARGQREGSFRATGTAEMRHDMLYSAIWYRFLFAIGKLDTGFAISLMETTLMPAPGWRKGWKLPR